MGWRKVCGTAGSGIWVLKGDTRGRMPLANLDHLSVQWRKQGSYDTARVSPEHDCLSSFACGRGAAVRPQTNGSIWDGAIGLWSRVAPFFVSMVCKRRGAYGSKSKPVRQFRITHPLHSDDEPLFGPHNSPKLIVSVG